MVKFHFDQELPHDERGFSVTIPHCGVDGYVATIRSLLLLLATQDAAFFDPADRYNVVALIQAMLPELEQLKY